MSAASPKPTLRTTLAAALRVFAEGGDLGPAADAALAAANQAISTLENTGDSTSADRRALFRALRELDAGLLQTSTLSDLLTVRSREDPGPDGPLADMLWRAGYCYNRIGLREYAAAPLRAALKILRDYPDDPHLPTVLLDLGNAVRKDDPAEAERCYQEAAEIYVARKEPESATSAWVNLGVMCSEQGRFDDSLAHYERALKVREQSLTTKPLRIGILLNNMANCYRRMCDFAEAHKLAVAVAEIDGLGRRVPIARGQNGACGRTRERGGFNGRDRRVARVGAG